MNQALAYQALAMLARLFRYGRLSYHGGFVNLRIGRTASLPVDPVVWGRMIVAQRHRPSSKATGEKSGHAMSLSLRRANVRRDAPRLRPAH